tara:strand:- start:2556 stop:3038 length:483 start_codon:yes stop_codon:yes gene_type:complete
MKNELTEKTFPVVIEEFSQSKFHHSDSTTLTIRKNDSINFHLFGLDSDGEYEIIMDYPFEINQKDSSQILIDKIPAKLVSEKQYSDKNKKLTVKKYYFDIENQADEEGNFFVMEDKVIAFSSDAWNLQKFYKYENSKIYELLKKDTTDFFYRFKSDRIIE